MEIQKRFSNLAPFVKTGVAPTVANEAELEGFVSRLNFINELVWKLAHVQDFEDARAFLDSVELHAGLVFQLDGADKYSWYVAHTSWVEGGLNVGRKMEFDSDLRALVASSVAVGGNRYEFFQWVGRAAFAGEKFLAAIEVAPDFEEVLGATIALNSWSALTLSVFSSQRLTEWVWR